MSGPPTDIKELAYYLHTLDGTRNLPYFKELSNGESPPPEYLDLGESLAEHGAAKKLCAHKSICITNSAITRLRKRTATKDGSDGPDVRVVPYATIAVEKMYVRLGYNTDTMVLRCMVLALNAPAPVIGYIEKLEMYKANEKYSNIFQITNAPVENANCNLQTDIPNFRLEFDLQATAKAALKKLCGYNTNNYSDVYINYIDSIFCNCKLACDVNAPYLEFVDPFMKGLCRDAGKRGMIIEGYENICACLGKGAVGVPSTTYTCPQDIAKCTAGGVLTDAEKSTCDEIAICKKCKTTSALLLTEAERFKCKCLAGGLTEEEEWQCAFNNDRIRFVCGNKDCVGDETGRVYQFEPNPPCQPYNVCNVKATSNALRFKITNLKICCGDECVTGSSQSSGSSLDGATAGALSGSESECAAGNASPVQRRQKATFAWIALIVLLLLLCAVFFK